MKKLNILLILLAFLCVGKSFAQPQGSFHVYAGYDLPLPDFKGTYPGDLADDPPRYFMKWGLNIGVDGKYFFGKLKTPKGGNSRNFGVTFSANYHNFTTGTINLDSSVSGSTGTYKRELNILALGLGVEYDVRPNSHLNPFFGAEVTGNFFINGKETFTPTSGTATERKQESEARFGVALGLGMDISASRNIGFIWGAKYHIANIVGADTTADPGTGNLPLNDGKTSLHARRLISWLGFYAGVSIYFGRPKGQTKMRM